MYLLLGYGKSNKSIERYLSIKNINYIIYDDDFYNEKVNLNNIKVIIKSNGIPNNHFLLEEAKTKNIKIISDLQYFYDCIKCNDYCLVTGSNGKTTIVSLLEKCINNSIAIGNNSLAFFDYINDDKYKILETSSFMLENINYINFKYNVISNIYPTHLEHHGNYINYIKSKLSFLKYLNDNNYVIYNSDDLLLHKIVNCYNVKKISVSIKNNLSTIYLMDNYIYYLNEKLLSIKNIKLLGIHNIYNIMLVLGVLLNHDLTKDNYLDEINNYKGEKYRMQIIYDKDIKIINDSKSTNFKALSVALDSFDKNIILIVGGQKRKDNYSLIDCHLKKIEKVYCYGENKEDFYNYFYNNKIIVNCYETLCDVIKEVEVNKDQILLFSPASVSHDQFFDFEHRGAVFNKLIKNKYIF